MRGVRFESLRMLKYRSWRSSILRRNILGQQIENFRTRLILFPSVEFVRFGGAFNLFVPFLVPQLIKEIHKTEFMITDKKHKFRKRERTAFVTPNFSGVRIIGRADFTYC